MLQMNNQLLHLGSLAQISIDLAHSEIAKTPVSVYVSNYTLVKKIKVNYWKCRSNSFGIYLDLGKFRQFGIVHWFSPKLNAIFNACEWSHIQISLCVCDVPHCPPVNPFNRKLINQNHKEITHTRSLRILWNLYVCQTSPTALQSTYSTENSLTRTTRKSHIKGTSSPWFWRHTALQSTNSTKNSLTRTTRKSHIKGTSFTVVLAEQIRDGCGFASDSFWINENAFPRAIALVK